MTQQCHRPIQLLLAALVACLPGVALASSGEAGGHEGFHWGPFILSWVNFLILAGGVAYILIKVMGPSVKTYFHDRSRRIADTLLEAQRLKEESGRMLKEYQEKLAAFEQTKDEELAKYRRDAERERDELIAAAHLQVVRMQEEAKVNIETHLRVAKEKLRKAIAEEVVAEAHRLIAAEIKPDDNSRIISRTIGSIGGSR